MCLLDAVDVHHSRSTPEEINYLFLKLFMESVVPAYIACFRVVSQCWRFRSILN